MAKGKSAFKAATPAPAVKAMRAKKHGGPPWCPQIPQGCGKKESKAFSFSKSYSKVVVEMGIAAHISVGREESITINLFKNLVEYLDVSVRGDTLYIKFRQAVANAQAMAHIRVKSALVGLTATGGCPVTIDSLRGKLVVSGGSPVQLDSFEPGNHGEYMISATGGSPVRVGKCLSKTAKLYITAESPVSVNAGKVPSAEISAVGGSQVRLGTLDAESASMAVSGGSSASGMSMDTLSLQVHGGSRIDTFVRRVASGSCSGGSHVTIHGAADQSRIPRT